MTKIPAAQSCVLRRAHMCIGRQLELAVEMKLRRMRMEYYDCPFEELWQEIQRRGYTPYGGKDELSEGLSRDDATRGTSATTIATVETHAGQLRSVKQSKAYGDAIDPSVLVGERITHWKLNTFFPTLQLFFESGLSCNIEGGHASVGIDDKLRFRLTDLTHEEDGVLKKSPLPEKYVGPSRSIRISEAVLANRISVSIKPVTSIGTYQSARIEPEAHVVVGLKLEGMSDMGYVWAKTDAPSTSEGNTTWRSTTIGGLRDDVPAPFFEFPQKNAQMGAQVTIVGKGSMINGGPKRREEFGNRW